LTAIITFGQKQLHIYGGKDHDLYLGCSNCDNYNTNSIWNSYGTYGSSYNSKSIWNKYGNYSGNYSDNSPFNKYASHPPVLVDANGDFYGYFTADRYFSKRTNNKLALLIIENWELISNDVSEAYEKIFN